MEIKPTQSSAQEAMEITPTQSAQEAALAAVNLGPVAPASSQIPETIESLTQTHGLLILERATTGEPTWFACKFCPIFGTKTLRDGSQYLRLYRAPFNRARIDSHLKRDHPGRWKAYCDLDPEQKRQFFQGKRLPPPIVFRERMKHLEKAWAPVPDKRKARRLAADALSDQQTSLPKRRKLLDLETSIKLLEIDDDWLGRNSFRPTEPTPENALPKIPKCNRALPGRNLRKVLCDVLGRYSEPFSVDLQSLIERPRDLSDLHDVAVTPPWRGDGTVTLAASALFYLLRGFPVDVASTLLQESAQLGWPLMQPSDSDVGMRDTQEARDMNQDITMRDRLPGMNTVIRPDSWETFVSDTAHFVEMAALLAIKRVLAVRKGWALALATRPCPLRKDALEIVIPMHASTVASHTESTAEETLTSADKAGQPENGASDTLSSFSVDIGDSTNGEAQEQDIVQSSAATLLSLAVNVFVLDAARERLGSKGQARTQGWVRARVKLCLEDALEFFCQGIGPDRAKTALKEISNIKKLTTEWVLYAPTDDQSLEGARPNYAAAGMRLPQVEWQAEKQVLCGLRLCVRAAKDSLRGSFGSPTIYAREILNKAIDDFDTTMPAPRKKPTQQDPLHLISVREGTNAEEAVTRLLDFVCPQWPVQLIGIHSQISPGSPLKLLETKLAEALKARKASDLAIVHKSMPGDKQPTKLRVLADMTPRLFEQLVQSYIKDTTPVPEGFVGELKEQHEILRQRKGDKNMKESWAPHKDLQGLRTFVRGLELLWSRSQSEKGDACQISGVIGDEVDDRFTSDREIERVFRARTLMDAERIQLLDKETSERQWTDTSPWKDYLVAWGGNWSNLLLSAND